MLYTLLRALAAGILKCWCRLRVEGQERVPSIGPVLLAANHTSLLDPPAVGAATHRRLFYMAKAELFRIPLFGALIRAVNARPVRREGSDPAALRLAVGLLREGKALLVFPEGTRGGEGLLGPAKAGLGMLALLSEAPVIPTFIEGTGRALPRGRMFPRPARVRVVFGPPLQFKRRKTREDKAAYQAVSDEIMNAIAALGASSTAESTVGLRQRGRA